MKSEFIPLRVLRFVGHSDFDEDNNNNNQKTGRGLIMGDDVFATGPSSHQKDGDIYGINDYAGLLQSVLASDARIEIRACYSAAGDNCIAYAFKKILPSASVYGYTGLGLWLSGLGDVSFGNLIEVKLKE